MSDTMHLPSASELLMKMLAGDLTREEGKVVVKLWFKMFWRLGTLAFVAFALGWGSGLGFDGFARAGDVDKKITKAVAPLSVQLSDLTIAVHAQGVAAKEQTLQLLRTAIVDAQVKKCRAAKEETAAIYRELVNNAQDRYYSLAGQNYPLPPCADL